jgi:hypothetical protein
MRGEGPGAVGAGAALHAFCALPRPAVVLEPDAISERGEEIQYNTTNQHEQIMMALLLYCSHRVDPHATSDRRLKITLPAHRTLVALQAHHALNVEPVRKTQ